MISGKEEASDYEMETSNRSCSKSFDRNSTKFCLWLQFYMLMKLWHDLALRRKEAVKLQSRFCHFVLKFQVSRRACYSFWRRPNLSINRWNFANPCKDFGARAKNHLLAVWGCPLKLQPHNCRLFLNRVFQRWRLKTTGQVSPVQLYKALQRSTWWS